MARLADNVRSALGSWWTLAQSAGYGGYTATDTISAAADLAGQYGQTLTFGDSSGIAVLFGYARRMSNAADVVQAAAESDYISPSMIATPPWARSDQEMATLPIWHVHFDLTSVSEGGVQGTERKVSVFRMTLPPTLGDLYAAVDADAEAMAAKYNTEFVSAQVMEIHSV